MAETPQQALTELRAQFRGTAFRVTVTEAEEPLQILSLLRFGEEPISVRLHLWGTEFQRQVWRAHTRSRVRRFLQEPASRMANWLADWATDSLSCGGFGGGG